MYDIIVHKNGVMIHIFSHSNKLYLSLPDFSGKELSVRDNIVIQAILLTMQELRDVQHSKAHISETYARWEHLLHHELVCPCTLKKDIETFLADLRNKYSEFLARQKEKLREALDSALSAASQWFSDEEVENAFRESFVHYVFRQ